MAERTDFYGSNTPKCPKSPCSFQKTGCSFHSFEPIMSKQAKKKSPANPLVYRTFWRRVRDSNPRFLLGTQHFECCKTLADSRLEQVVSGHFVKRQKRRRRKGLRTFRPVSARGDSNRPKVQIKPRSCVKSLRSCAFARSQARKQRPRQHR